MTTPFIAAVTIVLYVDLRVRKEGFDLALLAARFGVRRRRSAGPPCLPAPPPLSPPPGRLRRRADRSPPYWPPPPGWKPAADSEET